MTDTPFTGNYCVFCGAWIMRSSSNPLDVCWLEDRYLAHRLCEGQDPHRHPRNEVNHDTMTLRTFTVNWPMHRWSHAVDELCRSRDRILVTYGESLRDRLQLDANFTEGEWFKAAFSWNHPELRVILEADRNANVLPRVRRNGNG